MNLTFNLTLMTIKKLTKQELEKMYYSNTNKKVCEILEISQPTLSKYLDQFSIKRKPIGNKDNSDKRKIILETVSSN